MSSMCQVHPMAAMVSPSVLTYRTVNVLGDVPPGRKNPLWYGASKRLKKLRGVTQLTQAEHSALRREWIEVRKQLEPTVREICETQGNW